MKQPKKMLGEVIQGILLGVMLTIAIGMMLAAEGGGRIFQYQGF